MIRTTHDAQVVVTEGEYAFLLSIAEDFDHVVEEAIDTKRRTVIDRRLRMIKAELEAEKVTLLKLGVHCQTWASLWYQSPLFEQQNYDTLHTRKWGREIILQVVDYNHLLSLYKDFRSKVDEVDISVTQEEVDEAARNDFRITCLKLQIEDYKRELEAKGKVIGVHQDSTNTSPDYVSEVVSLLWIFLGLLLAAIVGMSVLV